MANFISRPTATIKANYSGQSGQLSVSGVTSGNTTLANAAQQINKILYIVNKGIVSDGMTRTITQEGDE